ncbi:cytochrome ubiquinol oxidase subunit I [Psychromonas antarctica]|jgi:cytochrome d ubiquinol oxidase subunit I|uniref:cytochrome ubiquinol oxidase subunit I n=1 Tax=Psychromonas antarctica TaxID=67573 RepID=UPI001EE87F8B|nr:cytochrome ubiquinol oxidase subunit I [Psychromonas antarctica]MCG6199948.1 cytochrome ubiquinol oxidase subunit I [Psychromonas antarctica]
MDTLALDLARFQFAFTVAFHIIFPSFTIGLASYLAVLEGLWLKTNNEKYIQLYKYWLKIFAVSFGMGVVSGIVLSYQFGTNWSVFSDKTGPILGPLMGYEILTAFFLEAGFLGVMLFGMQRVGKKLHFASTCVVAFGTFLSAFWILSVNSWMQTPAGYAINEVGQFIPDDWFAIIFNPSFPYRLVHMLLASYLTTALVVSAVGAYHLIKAPHNPLAKTMFSMALWMITIVTPIQIIAGDLHGLNTLQYQPAKVAAMEGHYQSHDGAPLILFGIPDDQAKEMRYQVAIPKLGSLILTHDLNGRVEGLDAFPESDHPPVSIVFWSFRVMVGIGFAMLMIGLFSLWLRKKGRLYDMPLFHRVCIVFGPAGFVAVLSGWITTEVGRQPFTVYGLLRTVDSASPIDALAISFSLAAFVVVYLCVFGAGFFYLIRLMRKSPTRYEKSLDPRLADGAQVPPASHPNRLT